MTDSLGRAIDTLLRASFLIRDFLPATSTGDQPNTKNPLIACLGRARVGNQRVYRFSLLTLLFSGVWDYSNPRKLLLDQVLQNFTLTRQPVKYPREKVAVWGYREALRPAYTTKQSVSS